MLLYRRKIGQISLYLVKFATNCRLLAVDEF
jgi:hypothetical protein